MTTTLFTHTDLARIYGLDDTTIGNILAKAKVAPLHQAKVGRGLSRFYEPTAARAAIDAHLAAKKPKPSEPAPAQQVPPKYLADVLSQLESLDERTEKAHQQNVLIWRAIETLTNEVRSLRETLIEYLDQPTQPMATEADLDALLTGPADDTQPTPAPTPAPAADSNLTASKAHKPRVVIVGLIGPQTATIQREFKGVFDLRFVPAGAHKEAARAVGGASAVICMNNFVDHGVLGAVRSARPKRLIEHSGGMSTLQTRLTELYVELSDNTQRDE